MIIATVEKKKVHKAEMPMLPCAFYDTKEGDYWIVSHKNGTDELIFMFVDGEHSRAHLKGEMYCSGMYAGVVYENYIDFKKGVMSGRYVPVNCNIVVEAIE